jgi:hypothetical protein
MMLGAVIRCRKTARQRRREQQPFAAALLLYWYHRVTVDFQHARLDNTTSRAA